MAGGRSIDDYREKRDFGRTPEPAPDEKLDRSGPPVFVVHRHEARRLHYDLRIEVDGVLRSWAVPKGFTYDPKVKHLAVRTEDHPIEYEHFSGLIPKGEYGAGSMTIWDRGTWELVGFPNLAEADAKGELKLILRGRRLRGEWHLVKTKQAENSWLLFKSKDAYSGPDRDSALGVDLASARTAAMPRTVKPMEPDGEVAPFSDPLWLFEAEFEGRRIQAEKKGDQVRFRGLRRKLPELEEGLAEVAAENALIDGVLVAQDEHERPSVDLLEERLASGEGEVRFYAFDLLYWEEYDLRPLPQVDRKAALRAVMPLSPAVLFLDHVPGNGEGLADAVAAAGLGALVAKRADAPWSAGPSEAWRRVPVDGSAVEGSVTERLAGPERPQQRSRVKLTNLDKVFWPAEGYTKGDLVAWYDGVADVILPYLLERPLHMNRFPDGIDGKSFYQKQVKEDAPDWVDRVPIEASSYEDPVPYTVCSDRDTLLWLANQGSIDLHPWLSHRGSLDSPDWAVLDLDPKEAPFTDVVRIAREIGKILRGIGLRPLLKTSGKTGLHVYVPLLEGYTYEHSRMFCEMVARMVVRDMKEIATVERNIASREGKVYVDFGQNRRGQTVVPPYSARPVRGATVSMPLHWDECDLDLDPGLFTIQTGLQRLAEHGDLFRPALADRQDLMPALEALAKHLERE